jgi:hypothetical protein
MKPEIRLGTAKVEITPQKPIPLAGFADRKGNFERIEHPLYARIWFFEGGTIGKINRSVLVQADLIWFGPERLNDIVEAIGRNWNMDEAAVILHASHTHCGPQTSESFVPSLGDCDPEYVAFLEARILEGLELASRSMELVTVEKGVGECRIGIHRRKWEDGVITMAPNPDGPLDPVVTVIRFRTRRGTVKGVMFHYACHPTTTGNNIVSSEFPGVAMTHIENELGGGAQASFLQGCCGDIRPVLVKEGGFYRGVLEDVAYLGTILADEVLRILASPMEMLRPGTLSARQSVAVLPYESFPDPDELERTALEDGVVGEWSRLLLSGRSQADKAARLRLNAVEIAEGLVLLGMNAEIVSEYGIFIKEKFKGEVLPLPYSNGMLGYVPTAAQLAEGGYEAHTSGVYFGMPSHFHPSIEPIIYREIIGLFSEEREAPTGNDQTA